MFGIPLIISPKINKDKRIEPKDPKTCGEWIRQVDVPLGKSGNITIDQFTFSERDSMNHRRSLMYDGNRTCMYVHPGTYTRMTRPGQVIMSDTPSEMWDHKNFVDEANGRVLLAGLGIGMVLDALARKPDVTHIRVVEINQDVIDLVWDHYKHKYKNKIELWRGSIFDYPGGETWDSVWIDIWDTKCDDNLDEMTELKKKFPPRRCPVRGFWAEEDLRRLRKNDSRSRSVFW